MKNIHKTAIVEEGAQVAEDVEIGPFSIIGPNVKIDSGTKIGPYVQIKNRVEIGKNNQIFHGTCIGENGQDLTFNNPDAKIVIGNDNVIREMVTIHQPAKSGNITTVGDKNYIMCNVHMGHDVVLGNNNIIATNTALGGYVQLENNVFLSGLIGVHQFVHIGSYAIVGAGTPTLMDVPPYCMMAGSPGVITGLNMIGMKRAKFSKEKIRVIKDIYKITFMRKTPPAKAHDELEKNFLPQYSVDTEEHSVIKHYISFLRSCKRGIAPRHFSI
ncbi:MAG: acyl-ACP--UDP-N-acetylglucosamine O-acyltransferase [Spirochaetia bacterium]|nr:acyl-ACP--UDP-N-acetylglucosamine O-acyltransferase [Spirochaetia bacterium]